MNMNYRKIMPVQKLDYLKNKCEHTASLPTVARQGNSIYLPSVEYLKNLLPGIQKSYDSNIISIVRNGFRIMLKISIRKSSIANVADSLFHILKCLGYKGLGHAGLLSCAPNLQKNMTIPYWQMLPLMIRNLQTHFYVTFSFVKQIG
jgi:hypothetical protein